MPKAIRIQQQGGPEVLKWEDVQVGDPGPGEARVRHKACGLNFVDVYQRSGLYKIALPSGMGNEGAGVVEAVGTGVTQVKAGDRVAYAGGAPGAYSEVRTMPADRLVVLPEGISFETAAAMMLKGVTVVYDSVGKDTFAGSLDCLQPRGLMVSFGNSSGAVPPFELAVLAQKGSLYLTRPTLATYAAKRDDLVAVAKDLFDVVLSGKVKIEVNHRYALKDAAQAQRDLEARKTTGSTILVP